MKYTICIDQEKSVKWGLNLSEAAMFDFCFHVPSWADHLIINGEVYYFASRNKALEEMPLITDKPDTVYRLFKALEQKGLIKWEKYEGKDWIKLTKKGLLWNKSEKNPSIGNISENKGANSENFPTLGKKSEQTRKKIRANSENFPTNKNTSNKNTIDNISLSIKENPKNENSENEPIKPKSEQKEKFRFDVQTSESELSAISNSVYSDREAKKVQYLEDFKNDYYAVESLTRKTKMDVSQVLRAADEFATDQIAKEDFQYPTYKDFKTHFYNWLLCNNLRLIKNWNYERDQNKSGNKRVNVVPAGGENPAKELAEKLLARPDIFIKW